MEFPCSKCGQCCRNIGAVEQLVDFNDGAGACIHLTSNNLCSIYTERPIWCNVAKLFAEQYRDVMTEDEWIKTNKVGCTIFSLRKKILNALKDTPNHPLSKYAKYGNDFITTLLILAKLIDKGKSKMSEKLLRMLCISNNFDLSKYLQGMSEIVIWRYFAEHQIEYEIEKKINNSNKFDVDLCVKYCDVTFNFEIKCPEMPKGKSNNLIINTGYRTVDKDTFERSVKPVAEAIGKLAVENSDGEYSGFDVAKNHDNKLNEYLKSCQNKFTYSAENEINILVLSLTIHRFVEFYKCLTNPYSGIFDEAAKQRFANSSNVDKTDVILFTTFIDKHIRVNDDEDAWCIDDVFNILVTNPLSKKFKANGCVIKGLQELLSLIPNETMRFDYYMEKAIEEINSSNKKAEEQNIIFELMLQKYLDQYHKKQWNSNDNAGG
ncbi:MAG: YkgJ family cysteine cluster protein [Prolixibacteraceae bacterium]|nr:YkgJ family cysteine cluster protein [Prolixibacteraceae bacterium]